jgi:hypothetical protein
LYGWWFDCDSKRRWAYGTWYVGYFRPHRCRGFRRRRGRRRGRRSRGLSAPATGRQDDEQHGRNPKDYSLAHTSHSDPRRTSVRPRCCRAGLLWQEVRANEVAGSVGIRAVPAFAASGSRLGSRPGMPPSTDIRSNDVQMSGASDLDLCRRAGATFFVPGASFLPVASEPP